ncbi:FadR/GntR family transcriptional regulator [Pantoea sp. SO10]|uniref:FadR/GntR family transcriptional regulator n=1 Tax=Pantoea sp. SO10 TaxID=2575375 RepID=UPI00143CC469|nr:FadR/GntR family transcriptional regulator [Pantoea sp. SO10]
MADQLVEDLGRQIIDGRLQPGELLPNETQLLENYGVSRTVLREALQILISKGMLDSRQRKGTTVRPKISWQQLDPQFLDWHHTMAGGAETLAQLMEVRRIVEPPAAALAATRASDEEKSGIQAAYERMFAAKGNVEQFIRADLEFHTAILQASQNQFLLPIAHAIRTTMLMSLRLTNPDPSENHEVSLPLHKALLDAILSGNASQASAAMHEHLDDTERRRQRVGANS